MRPLRRFIALLVGIETALLVLSLSTMVLLSFGQVVLRNLFNTGVLWADPLVRQMVLWSGFLGAALATHGDRHITIDALTKYISPRLRTIMKVITGSAAAVITWYLADAAWIFLLDERAAGGELFLGIPSWGGLLIIPVGYWLMMVHFAANAITGIHAALRGVAPAADPAGRN
jgi:TRAP-type C4-dicarboxylate transport system permease small subunit